MTYKKLIEKLDNDTSIEELRKYLNGTKKFNSRAVTTEQKQNLVNKIIPNFIKEQEKDIEELTTIWLKVPPLFRLAYIHCLNNKISMTKMYDIAEEIVNRISKDHNDIAITQRFKEYYNRTKDVELI